MTGLLETNLIKHFDFYLAFMMVLSLWRRWRVYTDAGRLAFSTFFRRQKLMGRLGEHKHLLLSGDVIRPLLVMIGLTVVQWICSRLIWPSAKVPLSHILELPWQLALLIAVFVPMFAVDLYFLIRVGKLDHGGTADYLDYAERWLGWRGKAVRIGTLGIVNPKKIVDSEVKKSLHNLRKMAGWAMWWSSVQCALRVAFGLTIWLIWSLSVRPSGG